MALKNTLDAEVVASRLAVALERHLPGAREARVDGVSIPSSNGLSNETVLFDATWTDDSGPRTARLAARVQPAGPAVFPRYDLGHEFAVMSALAAHTGVPVPPMFFHEPDADLLGAPFLVMGRVDGRVPSDDPPHTLTGWVRELTAEQQRTLYDNALRTLARVHAVDIDAVGLAELPSHPESGLDGQLALWRRTFDWAREGQSNPTIEAALEWVAAHRPAPSGPDVLNWGDARIGNLLFDDGLAVAGVLDWEMVCHGPRELDLGWWLLMQRYYSEGIGAPELPGFPDRDTFIARYREFYREELRAVEDSPVENPNGERPRGRRSTVEPSNVEPASVERTSVERRNVESARVENEEVELADLHFYEVLAALRLSILMHRAGNLMIAAGLLPPGAPMRLSNPASHLLARLLDLPAPVGETQSFAGNR